MHTHDSEAAELLNAITEYAKERMAMDPPPLDNYLSPAELAAAMPVTITEEGIGGLTALDLFVNTLAPASLSTDHPGYLSFIPPAPTEASIAFDLVVSASAIYGGSWVEGSGAVYAENETIAWLVREVGFPEGAGGVFVQGGTIGNLSALVAAREHAKATWPALPARWKVACSVEAHSSLKSAARVMDFDLVLVDSGDAGRMTGAALAAALDAPVEGSPEASAGDGVFAIVATGGTTNFGIVDQLDAIADVANARGIWFHVDGAYGLAGILAETTRPLFKGAERADSFIVDPHKWLFAPFDACALVYRDPEIARKAHTQHAEYLDTLNETGEWNPSDYAVQLTRRPRGLPLWFSLATYGVAAYRTAIQYCVDLTQQVAKDIRNRDGFELVRDPELSVVVFTRDGWDLADYNRWSDKLLADGIGFIVPSSHRGKVVMRFALLNPRTTFEEVSAILDSMA